MTEEEKKQLADAKAAQKTAEDALAAEKTAHEATKAQATTDLAAKDVIIKEKTEQVVGARREYKKLSEMSEKEKGELSAAELELKERQEKFDTDLKTFQDNQAASLKKEVDARKAAAIAKYAGKDADLAKKIGENFDRIKDSDKAQTEEEIAKVATEAFNMAGVPRPDPVRGAINNGGNGEAGGDSNGQSFAETKAGTDLMAAMGLATPKPAADGGAK